MKNYDLSNYKDVQKVHTGNFSVQYGSTIRGYEK